MANYSKKKGGAKRTASSNKRFLTTIIFAFLGGYLFAWCDTPAMLKAFFQTKKPAEKRLAQPTNQVLPKPKFEFYTLLTQEKKAEPQLMKPVAVKPSAPPVPSAPPAPPIQASQSGYQYVLQLASFQRKEDAEQMKAKLTMQGLDVQIKAVTQQNGVWFRVVMGPFGTQQAAQKIQSDMVKREHISGIVRRMDA
jgi:cell division protein FtsN